MQLYSTEALILKRRNFGEADKLITIFTRAQGKVATIAKGVRKITSRRAGSLELLNHVKVSLHQTKGLPILTEAQNLNSFPNLKENLEKLSSAFIVLELVDRLIAEEQENQVVFDLMVSTLQRIDQAKTATEARKFQTSFQIKLLTEVGYLPQLYNCANCREKLQEERNFLSPNNGGLVDSGCNRETILSRPIEPEIVKALRFLNNQAFSEVVKLELQSKLLREASSLLNYYTVFFLERELNSTNFAEAIYLVN